MKRRIKYDRMITIFSPEGRLLQVEYALETVKKGGTMVGVTIPEGVVLGAEEATDKKFVKYNSSRKVLKIDDHLGTAIAGLKSDARILVDKARTYAQSHRLTYDEPMDAETLVKKIGDLKQSYTQYASMRPFGVSMLIGGVDRTGNRLFVTHPAGTYKGYQAHAVGAGSETAIQILKEEYRDNMNLEEAAKLTARSLSTAMESRGISRGISMAFILKETKKFRLLTDEEIQPYK